MDAREIVVAALRGGKGRSPYRDPLAGLGDHLVVEALPKDLDLEGAVRRLLGALKAEAPAAYRRLLVEAAAGLGLHMSEDDPRAGNPSERLDRVLGEAARTTIKVREWAERLEVTAHAVAVRAVDPGSKDPAGRCRACRVPALIGAALARADHEKRAWLLVLVPGV